MKKVFYFSISANPWQRSALLDSAIQEASNQSSRVTFLQAYEHESSPVDLPLSSFLDYKLAKLQNQRINRALSNLGILLEEYSLFEPSENAGLSKTELEVGYEETIVKTRDSRPCKIHTKKLIEHYGLIYYLVYQKAFEFLKLHRPDWIFIFNGRFYREKAIWKAAQDLGIKVKFIERFSPAWEDRYFEFERPVHSIEYRCSIMRNYWAEFSSSKSESEAKNISEKWFLDRSQGVSQTFTKEQNLNFKRNTEIKTLVTFFHSSEDELFSTDLGSTTWNDQIEFLRKLQGELSDYSDLHLLIRVHPNLKHKSSREIMRWKEFQSESIRPNVTFVMQDSSIKTYDILKESDFVVTFGSTIGVEASFFGKPSLLVSRAFHESLNVVIPVNGMSELLKILNSGVNQAEISKLFDNTVQYGLFHALGGISFRHLKRKELRSQDPSFYLNGSRLGSWKLISFVRRFEGAIRKTFFPKVKLDCSCV